MLGLIGYPEPTIDILYVMVLGHPLFYRHALHSSPVTTRVYTSVVSGLGIPGLGYPLVQSWAIQQESFS